MQTKKPSFRPAAGTYINLRLAEWWKRNNRVVTITPDVRHAAQTGAIHLARPVHDGTVIAPYNLPQDYKLPFPAADVVEIGYLLVKGSPDTRPQRVTVLVTRTAPAIVFLQNHEYLSQTLYTDNDAQSLRRLAFFNRAALALLREAEVDPRILHVVDWPTALSLLFLDEERIPIRHSLFTYPNARFQGIFDRNLQFLLGLAGTQKAKDLQYYADRLSLAQAGLLRASLTYTRFRGHVAEVMNGVRHEGGDWGEFQKLFKALGQDGRLFSSYVAFDVAERIARIDMLSPAEEQLDDVISELYRYNEAYTRLVPVVDIARVPEIRLFDAAEGGMDFSPYTTYGNVLAELKGLDPDILPQFKALIRAIGSRAALLTMAAGTPRQKGAFLNSLRQLSPQWYDFAAITRKALYGTPRPFEKVESVETVPVLEAEPHIKAEGLRALLGDSETAHCNLLVLTMSGGLGQRLAFNIQVSSDVTVAESALQPAQVERLAKLEKDHKLNMRFNVGADHIWFIPKDYLPELPGLSLSLESGRLVKLPAQILSPGANDVLARANIPSVADRKQDSIWLVPADKFQALFPELEARSNSFVRQLLLEALGQAAAETIGFVNIPKGVYRLPGEAASLFEAQARSITRLAQAAGKKVFWGIMLSRDNQAAVREYFQASTVDNKYFGVLETDRVQFDIQGDNPIAVKTDEAAQQFDIVVDADGNIVSESNGHGGFHDVTSNLLGLFGVRIDHVLGCNIENVLFNEQLGDLDFITGWLGQHVFNQLTVSGLCTAKVRPTERMGILAEGDNVSQVVEYNHPSFTARHAFAYSLPGRGTVYFVRDPEGKVLAVSETALPLVFPEETPPGKANVAVEKGRVRPGYELLERQALTAATPIVFTDDKLQPTGETSTLAMLGEPTLIFRQGNTNIFIFNTDFIDLVESNPAIMAAEEHKLGDARGGRKIEKSIFGPLSLVRLFEALPSAPEISVGFVEADRADCFEPVKEPADVAVVLNSLIGFRRRFPS